ncbi:hypothetical protein FOL47_005135 [Perkinsus chesapeaki]|uniref:Hemerythrin-like domain-containing protein n=1 Tax=Perkinsus chesapeaki TaxID=330153 RepID=A0A7J6LYP3_PERCH|nr:hypothetical protein FOL47_005135 [Perkinsus chesapeaki]
MGNYIWGAKKVASKDYFEEFVFGQKGVHNVIKRSFAIAAKRKVSPTDVESFKQFIDMTGKFLLVHHLQEDEYIFPFYRQHLKEPEALEEEGHDHEKVSQLLKELEKALKEDKIPEAQEICAKIGSMFEGDNGHFAREERILTSEAYREHCKEAAATEKEVRQLSKNIHDMIGDHMDRTESLVFMIYNLNDAEKAFFDERMPWIMTYLIFPMAANKKPEVFAHCAFPRYSSPGKLGWYGDCTTAAELPADLK